MKLKIYRILGWIGLISVIFSFLACDFIRNDFEKNVNAANLSFKNGDYDEAIRLYSKVLWYPGVSNENKTKIYFNRGLVYSIGKGQYDKAIVDFNRAIERKPGYAFIYYSRGNAYHGNGQYGKAIADFNHALVLKPDYADAYNNRGNAYNGKGQYDKADADYNRALELNPDHILAYNNRGNAYGKKGQYDKAVADFNRAIELKPDHALAYYNRGLTYHKGKGQYDKAIIDYSRAIELKPDSYLAYNNRGIAYSKGKGQYDKAIIDYNRAIELKPDNALAYYNRGYAYGKKGQYDKAIADYSRVIELKPDHALAYKFRGIFNFNLARYGPAADNLKQAVKLNPHALYSMIWLYLATERQGKEGKPVLKLHAKAADINKWPGPVVSMFLGAINANVVLKKTTEDKKIENERKCEAYFYIGQYYLIQGNKKKARALFQQAVDTGVTHFVEYTGAKEELKRI